MTERTITIGGSTRAVGVEGPDGAPGVLVLASAPATGVVPDMATITARLVNSGMQAFVLEQLDGLGHDEVVAILDQVGLHWVSIVGIGDGAALAWQTAARHFERTTSLVVLDHGHPAAADVQGDIADAGCPAVEVATTLVLATGEHRSHAYATGRHAYSDYRVVELPEGDEAAADGVALATALATEIILRSNPW
ncbi:MAG: alpha/beta hydrolase [Tomitella sp.]|nr:alpha/beta hydrolase [Tomitella sp.]